MHSVGVHSKRMAMAYMGDNEELNMTFVYREFMVSSLASAVLLHGLLMSDANHVTLIATSRTLVCGHCLPAFSLSLLYSRSIATTIPTTHRSKPIYRNNTDSTNMLKRLVVTAPRATRALSTSVRPALTSPTRIAPAASRISRRCYHEKDMLPCSTYHANPSRSQPTIPSLSYLY